MTFEEKISKLYERFAYAGKGGTNQHFKYAFVQESTLKRTLNQAMRDLGLYISSLDCEYDGDGKAGVATVAISITDGRALEGRNPAVVHLRGVGGGMDSSDKAPQKAMVAAMKYALLCGLSVETGEQLDTEADPGPDAAEAAALVGKLEQCSSIEQVSALKLSVSAFQGSDLFEGLRAAYYRAAQRVEEKV